ncbi:MAG: MBOAT family protein [Alphaproteobacteria bacterium]|nr:MBOAT family protein [Alphaproteobacteria bacterium]
MLFNSTVFILLFLPISYFIYFYLNNKRLILGAKAWLVAASLFFYGYWKISYLPIILASIVINFVIGAAISKDSSEVRINKKFVLTLGIIGNVLALCYYKYTDFIVENINQISGSNFSLPQIVLPLAISFFTFQQIAYLVDSYKGNTKEYDFLTYALFITFFPQLIAGPIVHHKEMMPQLIAGPIVHHKEMMPQFFAVRNLAVRYKNVATGLFIFIIGLFKKVAIADVLAITATNGFDHAETLNFAAGWLTSLSYTFQLYYDFSGYCDMAIGSALMFNIKLPINFNSPYKATDIQDFWRRWHMTLSKFLRDYIYIPLGGNKVALPQNCLNLMIVFVVGGIWHGAAWTFVIWGLLHGAATVVHRLWQALGIKLNKFIAWFITFNFINVAWVFFRAPNFEAAKKVLFSMVDIHSLSGLTSFKPKYLFEEIHARSFELEFMIFAFLLAVFALNSIQLKDKFSIKTNKNAWLYGVLMGSALIGLLAKIVFVPYSEFIYFNF